MPPGPPAQTGATRSGSAPPHPTRLSSPARTPLRHPEHAGVPGTAETADRFGASVHLSDLDGDGKADLSVGSDGENHPSGAVYSLRGSAPGVTTKNTISFGPGSLGRSTTGYLRLGQDMLS
ncbi:FG-GAP repeat protein [Streptomyces caelestis]